MRIIFLVAFLWLAVYAGPAFANNIAVENVSLTDKDTGGGTYDIKFDVAWENSWFIAGAPLATANWDAAWAFAKYSVYSGGAWGAWLHCNLSNAGYVAPAGSQMSFGLTESDSKYKGAFIYRSGTGSGPVDWNNAEIRWNYRLDGVADDAIVKVRVFAVEMVYIPECTFFVGDTDNDQTNCFYEGGSTHEFQISSEGAITVGNAAGQLYYDQDNANAGDRLGPVPADFPKGYNDFYIMKYEISQREYCEFLNTLAAAQQTNRHYSSLYFNSSRNFIKKTSASPAFFGCDANDNAGSATAADKTKLNESDDGEWVACNYLSWGDVIAYADWAALRPFTELEFEKATRGGQAAQDDEYVWGTTLETATTSLNFSGQISEAPNQGNCNYLSCSPDGPYRTGSYADGSSSRTNAGAGYYGTLDMGGSLWERPVTVGNGTPGATGGRDFTGLHGDGLLNASGQPDVTYWPSYSSATGSGLRGGGWDSGGSDARVSDRYNAANTYAIRYYRCGGRAARTSP